MAVAEQVECSSAQSSSLSKGVHYLAKCVIRGSVVLQVVYGHIRSPFSRDVVFGKETSIELVIIGEDGIVRSICEQAVFGIIKDLAILRWNEKFHVQNSQMTGKDLIVILSDSGKLSFLTFCNELHRFFPVRHIQLSNAGNSTHHLGRMLTVDSSGCFMAASAYEDRLVLFSISASRDIVDQKIYYPSENEGDNNAATGSVKSSICGTIWSMCFISKEFDQLSQEHSCLLAILLNRRGASLNELLLLEWNTRENAAHVTSQYAEAGSLAHDIIDIPHFPGFAFLFMLVDVLLMDLRDAHNPCCVYRINLNSLCPPVEEKNLGDELFRLCDVDDERIFNVAACALLELRDIGMDDGSKCPNPMKIDGDYETSKPISRRLYSWTWGPGDDKNPRLIFCVDTGEFYMFEVCIGSSGFKINHFDCLYRGLACKELLWIEGGFLAALYEMGDGMVFKLENGKLLYNSPIQNIAPILNMSVVDYHKEKQDQMFACCGVAPEGSLRIIQNGISVDKLLKTAPVYQGITGTWTIRMRVADPNHSFLVLSFVEETRVLSVGLSFSDVTDSVGFQSDASTLACGIVRDGLLVQIHQYSVRLCLPTKAAHSEGIPLSSPISTSWLPDNSTISLGAVKSELIIVATSNPCLLFILGVRSSSAYHHEIYEMQHVRLRNEVSCISIPQGYFEKKPSASLFDKAESFVTGPLAGVDINHTIVIGTHKPSVEVLTFVPGRGLRALATGPILLTNTVGTAFSGCVPQDVRLVLVDKFYVLSGLRNGMLLRFELPAASLFSSKSHDNISYTSTSLINSENMMSNLEGPTLTSTQLCMASLLEKTKDNSPVCLQLISIRRIGITPVFLVPLSDSLDADIIALSDRPWLLHTARHSLSYTSISFQPSTHVTPVCSVECPKGILFVAENSLHLVEMMRNRRLNVQKFNLEGTPRKVIYHNDSRLLFVMRTDLDHNSCSSDICGVDPLSGSVISSFKFNKGETGKSMILMRVGNEHILVVGTSRSSLPAILPSGEAESIKGRLLVLVIEHIQNSDSGSMTHSTKADSSSQRTSPFHESVGLAAEQLSSSSLCSSPDDSSYDGVKLEDAEAWHLRLDYACVWTGVPLALFPYLDRYFLASCGDSFYVCGFQTDGRVRKFAVARTRFMIVSLTAHLTRIAVGDCRDGILFFSYHEESRKLEHLYSDPEHRLVADCILIDEDTAVVSDRKGCISVLSSSDRFVNNASPERNLRLCSSYYTGEVAMSIRKGSFSYKLPVGDVFKEYEIPNTIFDSSHSSIITSTLLGSIMVFIPITREENDLLEALQERLAIHPLTAPLLGNDHTEFRSRETSARCRKILDGDMLMQFLELTSTQQEAILSLPLGSPDTVTLNSKPHSHLSANRVAQLLERIHHSLG